VPNNTSTAPIAASTTWRANQVYKLSSVFLLIGLAIGYFFPATKITSAPKVAVAPAAAPLVHNAGMGAHPIPTMDQMKQMAAVQTSALVEKLKADPNNAQLLLQVAAIYKSSHQFKEASDYYARALKINPKNVSTRTELASCLYYGGDVDGAIAQLNQSLQYNPTDPNSLFNLGLIKWKGRNDAAGAIATWEQLLKTNPNLDRKPIVEQMIAEAKGGDKPAN
jgi:cytochrome c-type biogenesis protein CcmH/NrfG